MAKTRTTRIKGISGGRMAGPNPRLRNKKGKIINRDVAKKYLVTEEDRRISSQRFGEFGWDTNESESLTGRQKQKAAELKLKRFMKRGGSKENLQKFVEAAFDSGDSAMLHAIVKLAGHLPKCNKKSLRRPIT